MANEKISQMPSASTSSGSDLYPLVQGGANKSITFSNLQASIASALTSGQLPSITLTGDITGSASAGSIATTVASAVVTSKLLTGFSVGANSTILAVDSILSAFGKVQGQINGIGSVAITSLTGDVVASGPGSATATLSTIVHKRYIDFVSGNDSTGTGTIIRPWKTLQHAYNSTIPSINEPYVFYLSGGNNDSDTAVTAKPNVSLVADYQMQVSPSFTISGGFTNDGCSFTNITFVGAFSWVRNDSSQIGVNFSSCEFFSGPIVKQTGAGTCTAQAYNSTFVNSEWQLPNGYGIFTGCNFLGTTTFDDPGSSGLAYYQFDGGYSSGAMTISGFVNPAYFTGFVHDIPYGASLTFVTTGSGTPVVEFDSAGLPPTYTGSPVLDYLSFAKYESYTPATPSNWSVAPTLVQSALDALASLSLGLTNQYYISKTGNDTTGNGSITRPFLTIGKAATIIGAAASNAAFNDATQRFYQIVVGPGVYVESPTFGTRPFVVLDLQAATLQGTLEVDFNQGAIFGSGIQQPKFVVLGSDLRSGYGGSGGNGIVPGGIDGNVNLKSIGSGSSLVCQFHMIRGGVTGNITQSLGSGGGVFTQQVFLESCIVAGTIQTSGSPGSITLYAKGMDTSGSFAIGGVSGAVNLNIIDNVRFDGAVVTSSGGGRWSKVSFASAANNFTGSSATILADLDSMNSFFANVPTKGSINFTTQGVLSGSTSSRPTPGSGNLLVGFPYFDTTLGIPIWASGSGTWVNALGASV